ncbi:MAG: tetratricopeptide repeat protein [Myxococcales bacterium]|nr:tetratricopeptide repeat protein [Myxococcales bacterium]
MRLLLGITIAGLLLLSVTDVALAQGDEMMEQEARDRFRLGNSLYEQGRFVEAAGEFQRAYELSERPALLYNIYLCHRDAGNTQEAADALRQYLRDADQVEGRPLLERRLEALDRQLAERAEPAEPALGSGEPEPEPEPAAAPPAATTPAQTPQGATAAAESPSVLLPIVLLGAGAVSLGVGIAFGLSAQSGDAELTDSCYERFCPPGGDLRQIDSNVERDALLADVFGLLGIASLVTGGVLLTLGLMSGSETEASAEAAPIAGLGCTESGCVATLRGSF